MRFRCFRMSECSSACCGLLTKTKLKGVAEALKYCHDKGIVHSDLKSVRTSSFCHNTISLMCDEGQHSRLGLGAADALRLRHLSHGLELRDPHFNDWRDEGLSSVDGSRVACGCQTQCRVRRMGVWDGYLRTSLLCLRFAS